MVERWPRTLHRAGHQVLADAVGAGANQRVRIHLICAIIPPFSPTLPHALPSAVGHGRGVVNLSCALLQNLFQLIFRYRFSVDDCPSLMPPPVSSVGVSEHWSILINH